MLRQRSVYGSAKSCFIPTNATLAVVSNLRNRRILPHNHRHSRRRILRRILLPPNRHYSKNRYFEIA